MSSSRLVMMTTLQAIAISVILGSIGADAVHRAPDSWPKAFTPLVEADVDKSEQELDIGHVGGLTAEAKQHFQATDSATKAMANQGGTPTAALSEMHSSSENDDWLTTQAPKRLAIPKLASVELTYLGQVTEPVSSLVNREESQTTGNVTSDGAVTTLIRRQKGEHKSGLIPISLLDETDATSTEVTVESTKTSGKTNEKVLWVSGLDVNGKRAGFNGVYYPGPDSTATALCKETWIKPCRETDIEACTNDVDYATYRIVYRESSDLTLRQWVMEAYKQAIYPSKRGSLEAGGRAYNGPDNGDSAAPGCSPEKIGDSTMGWQSVDAADKDDLPTVSIYTTTTTTTTTVITTTTTTTPAPATPAPGQSGHISTTAAEITTSNTDFETKNASPGLSRSWLKLLLPLLTWLAA